MARKQNSNSLANLNPYNRFRNKKKANLTLLPETIVYLKTGKSMSDRVDQVVRMIRDKELVLADKAYEQNLTDQIKRLEEEKAALQSRLKESESAIAELKFKLADRHQPIQVEPKEKKSSAPEEKETILNRLKSDKIYYSDREVAEAVGVNPYTVNRWRNGKRSISPKYQKAMSAFSNCGDKWMKN